MRERPERGRDMTHERERDMTHERGRDMTHERERDMTHERGRDMTGDRWRDMLASSLCVWVFRVGILEVMTEINKERDMHVVTKRLL